MAVARRVMLPASAVLLPGAGMDNAVEGRSLEVKNKLAVAVKPALSVAVALMLCVPDAKLAVIANGAELSVPNNVAPS